MKYDDPFFVHRDIRDGLVGEWNPGEDISQVVDLSGKGNDGVITGATRVQDDILGGHNVLSFDGIDDFVTISNLSDFWGVGKKTIVLLVCPVVGATSGQFFSIGNNVAGEIFMLGHHSVEERMSFTTFGTNYNSANDSVPYGKWYYIVITLSLTHYFVYINGNFIATGGLNHTLNIGETDATIGRRHNSTEFVKSKVAMLRLYNQQLSADEINVLYRFIHKKYGVLRGFND